MSVYLVSRILKMYLFTFRISPKLYVNLELASKLYPINRNSHEEKITCKMKTHSELFESKLQ